MSLEAELQDYRRQLATDAYPMSIGELSNLYRDGELDIHPEFQRIFRWTGTQKTRLIESILLGIPLPSIFVAQNEAGVWDVVDGVQRLSTIFQFMGLLKDDEDKPVEPLVCVEAPFLKSMAGMTYEPQENSEHSLDPAQRLDFKRARIDVKIIKRESDTRAKYDLFQRLNSYGSPATQQELRDCLLVSLSKSHFYWLTETAEEPAFLEAIELPERLVDESYHHELALRFIVLRQLPEEELPRIGNIGEYLTNSILNFVERDESSLAAEREVFVHTFKLLAQGVGPGVLRKWRTSTGSTTGPFSLSAFEALALGIGYYDADARIDAEMAKAKRIELWSDSAYQAGFATGMRADTRMRQTIPTGRKLFAP